MENIEITFHGDWSNTLPNILKKSFDSLSENLPESLFQMEGMSGKKYRSFINSLVKNLNDVRYLEIGSWKGSTVCSALYNNKGTFTCIDNWEEFGGPKKEFEENTKKYINQNTVFNLIEKDFRQIDFNSIGKYNIYLYDGPHTEKDQHDGVQTPINSLDDYYILIVDDYNWYRVQTGTKSGLEASGQKVISSITITTRQDGQTSDIHGEKSDWHNGYYMAVIQK